MRRGIPVVLMWTWRTRIEQKASGMDLPIDFLLTWVKHESFGNPCSLGVPLREAGIGQTWHPDDDRFGATFDELRAACVPNTQKQARPLTEAEKDLQVTSLVGLVKSARDAARAQMVRADVTWPEPFASLAQRRRRFDDAEKTGSVVGATGDSAGDQ